MKQCEMRNAKILANIRGTQMWCRPSLARSISIPVKIVITTTNSFPKNRTVSPIVLIVNTRNEFDINLWNAFDPALKNESP